MKNMFFTFLAMCLAVSASAQLTNNGATIIVEDGAKLFIETDLNNNVSGTTGTITVQGTGIIEVQGNLTNAGTVTMSDNSKLIFSGTGGSNVTSGGATFSNVELDKTAEDVTLLDEMRISQDLNFVGDDNKIVLGNNNLVLAPQATITSADDNEYVVADGDAGTGVLSKELDADEVFTYHVGDATNYTPLAADVTGTAYSSATVGVNTVGMKQPNVPLEATDFINRYWNVDQAGVTDFSADLTGTYVAGDLESGSTAADVKGAHYSADWSYDGAAAGANAVTATIADNGDFTGTNSFGRANLKLMLDGAFGGGVMSNTLNTMDLLPTTSPYGGGETVAADFFDTNTDIVDWVEFETRNSATPATVEGSGVGFVKTDGSVVSLDGMSNPFLKNAATSGYVIIKHRNHLSVCTGASIDLDASVEQDFTSPAYTAFGTNAMRNNGGTMTMWSGDTNNDGSVVYVGSTTDIIPISTEVFLNPTNTGFSSSVPFPGYNAGDSNMDGETVYVGGTTDITPISLSVFFNPANTSFQGSFVLNEQLPE